MSESDGFSWNKKRMPVSLMVGEVCLWRSYFNGIVSKPDIFSNEPISFAPDIIKDMETNKAQVAYIYSCPMEETIKRLSIKGRFFCYVDSKYKHFYVKTNGDFDEYLGLKRKKTISTLKRKIKKVDSSNKEGDSLQVYSSPADFEEFFKLAMPISKQSYQHRLFDQGLDDTDEFKNNVINQSKKGQILGFILIIDGKPAAYNLCPIYDRDKVLYDYTGYDPDYSKFSPGTVLQYKIIEYLFQRDDLNYYDLCTGEGQHKELFATGDIYCGNMYVSVYSPKLVLLFLFKHALFLTTELIKKILDKINMKEKVKKNIRRMA